MKSRKKFLAKNLHFWDFFYIFAESIIFNIVSMNIFVKKTMASTLGMPMEQVEAIINAAEAFRSNEIDRNTAIEVFNKLSKKSPKEINELLKTLKNMV